MSRRAYPFPTPPIPENAHWYVAWMVALYVAAITLGFVLCWVKGIKPY